MTPFSPLTYIKRNRARVISIIMILACTCIVFMGGMYIDNINEAYNYAYEEPSQYAMWYLDGNNNDIIDERRAFVNELEDMLPENAGTVIPVHISYGDIKSIMGFNNGGTWFFMNSKEDFDTFVEYTDRLPKDINISDGGMVLSEWLANNWGVKEGDVLKAGGEFEKIYFPADMTVEKVLPLTGIQIYGWSSAYYTNEGLILPTVKGAKNAELTAALNDLRAKVKAKYPHIEVVTNESMREDVKEQTSFLTYLFSAVILIVAVVFAVTVNATFAAMYDKRKYEFSIYKALGFSKGKIFRKVLGELLAMDGLGLVAGGAACYAAVKILNEILWEQGQHFIRPSVMGIVGTIACNIAIIIPVLMSNMRRVKKYDVTVY